MAMGSPASVDLYSLVSHSEWVPAHLTLAQMVDKLNRTPASYVAVQNADRIVGVVSRETIGLLFGGRYGFSLFADEPVISKLEPDFLAFRRSTPILEVLNSALNRGDTAFKSDIVLLDDDDRYLGMIPIYRLAQLQSRLLLQHVGDLQKEKERYRDLVENANDIIFTTVSLLLFDVVFHAE